MASNGKQALSELEKKTFDLVLMDVQMPEMDGIEATMQIREREKLSGSRQPVVAMTALVMKGDRERCLAAGMDGFISKPIRPQDLDEVLDRYTAEGASQFAVCEPVDSTELPICTRDLVERIDGDPLLLVELVELLREDSSRQLRTAQEAIANRDVIAVQRLGHALRKALANLAAPLASRAAEELESIGKSGDLSLAKEKLGELERELARAIQVLETRSGPIALSISIGAITIENWEKTPSADPLLTEVDVALYRAKAAGRNRVVFADAMVAVES